MFALKALNSSRRDFLGAAATGAAALAPAAASSARRGGMGQTIHKSGRLETMVLSDGHFSLPTGFLLTPDAPPAERDAVLKTASVARRSAPTPEQHRGDQRTVGPGSRRCRHRPAPPADGGKAGRPSQSRRYRAHCRHDGGADAWPSRPLVGVLDAADNPVYPERHLRDLGARADFWSDPDVLRALPPVLANDRIVGERPDTSLASGTNGRRCGRRRDHQRRARDRDSRAYAGPYLRGALGGDATGDLWGRAHAPRRFLPAPLMEGAGGP